MTSSSITKRILTVLLSKALGVARPMCRARFKGVMSPYTAIARFWERVGGVGEALETLVDRLAARSQIDISEHMMNRAYSA